MATVLIDALEVRIWPDADAYVLGHVNAGDRIAISHRWAGEGDWFAIPNVGWVPYTSESISPDIPSESITKTYERASGPNQPSGATTGVGAIDQTIAAVLSGDAPTADGLLDFQELACSITLSAPGGVACPAGVEDGSTVDVFVRSVYEADASPIVRQSDGLTIDEVVQLNRDLPPQLYAVAVQRDVWILDKHYDSLQIAFFSDHRGSGFALRLDDRGRIVAAVVGGPAVELFQFFGSTEITLGPAAPDRLDGLQ